MFKYFVFLIISSLSVSLFARDTMEFDFYWELQKKLNDEYTVMYAKEDWGYKNIEGGDVWLGVYYKPCSWLTIHPFLVYSVKIPNYHDHEEIRPGFNVFAVREIFDGWKIQFRTQQTMRCIKGEDNPFYRMRNRIDLFSPWKWTKYEINPRMMIIESWFHTQENWERDKRFFRYRSAISLGAKISENLSMSTWFLKQWTRHSDEIGGFQGLWQTGVALVYSF